MAVILYSTHCPSCNVLEKKLQQKGVEYVECNDVNEMLARGLSHAPALDVNGNLMNYAEAIKWVNAQEAEN